MLCCCAIGPRHLASPLRRVGRLREKWMRSGVGRAVRCSAAALVALAGAIALWPAGDAAAGERQPAVDPLMLTGRHFGGLRLGVSAQRGEVGFAAARARVWTETDREGRTVQRMLLRGDVRVDLGAQRITAARAVVWVERIEAEREVHQVAVYFDRALDPGGQAGIALSGERLMVTGVFEGGVGLSADSLQRGRPVDEFVIEAEARMARLLRRLAGVEEVRDPVEEVPWPVRERPDPRVGLPRDPGQWRPFEPPEDPSLLDPEELEAFERAVEGLPPAERPDPIFAEEGIVTFAAGEPTLVRGEEENAVMITGGVVVQYSDPRRGRSLEIRAERAVAFLPPGPILDIARHGADSVRGIYLEGDVVATDGQYTLRGPRMYYDIERNKAIVLEAVFWTYDERRGLPLYVRARSIRQEAANQFSSDRASVAVSGFFDPYLSVGTTSVTVTRRERPGRPTLTSVDARNITLNMGPVPVFYWPRYKGDIENFPLRDVRFENSSRTGFMIGTTWDVFGLLGRESPEWFDASLIVDGYFERGAALGTDLSWNTDSTRGEFFAYGIFNDTGRDELAPGSRRDRTGETRGLLLGEHVWTIDENWTAFLEGAYVSDENFTEAFFRPIARTGRELTNAALLRRRQNTTSLTLLAKGSFHDFVVNDYLLQTRGYSVDKLPEIGYTRLADDLLGMIAPGLVSYSSDYRFSRMSMRFTERTPRDFGFRFDASTREAFGIGPDDSFADALRAAGLTESDVYRFDTRHELSVPFSLGPVNLAPFAVGRATVWDNGFGDFAEGDEDRARWWGAAGVRASTSIQRVYNGVDVPLLDIHRLRHIIEPNVTFWSSTTNRDAETLPIYDADVESIASGTAVRFGVLQTWQTMRGGHGRWRSVDFLTLSVDAVFSSNDADKFSPIGRFFDYRPEYSMLGNYLVVDAAWQVTDALGVGYRTVYDFDDSQPSLSVVGTTLQHSPDFATTVELRHVNVLDRSQVGVTSRLRLTPKYDVSGHVAYDLTPGEFRTAIASLSRRFSDATLGVSISYSKINDEFSFGFMFQPAGVQPGQGVRLRQDQSSAFGRRGG